MMVGKLLVIVLLLYAAATAQTTADDRISLEVLVKALSTPAAAELSEIVETIQVNGIRSELTDDDLGKILKAGREGNRDPKGMAALIRVALDACQDCRARYLTPLSIEEFRTLLKRFTPEAVSREVRARGINGLDPSEATQNALRAWGAKEDLIAFLIPDDKIPTIPLQDPYKPVGLKRAQEYDATAQEGWLRISMELQPGGQSEFIFKHTGLFVKTADGGEPSNIQAFFNKPAPRNKTFEFISIECGLDIADGACGPESLDEKRGTWVRTVLPKKSKSKKALVEYTYVPPDGDGRAGFQIAVTNPEKTAQKYALELRWRVLDAPKAPPPVSGGKGAKR